MANNKDQELPADSLRRKYDVPPEELTDGNLTLRRWQLADGEASYEAARTNLDELIEWMTWATKDYDLQSAQSFMSFSQSCWENGTSFDYAAVLDGKVCGSFSLMNAEHGVGSDIGYWLARPATGKGVATRATKLLLKAAFDANFETVQIMHDVRNVKSEAIPKRLGFTYKETNVGLNKGKEFDRKLWQLTRNEYLQRQEAA